MPNPADNEPLAAPFGVVETPPAATGAPAPEAPPAGPSDLDVVEQAIAAANAGNGLPQEAPPLEPVAELPVNPDGDPSLEPPQEGEPEPATDEEPPAADPPPIEAKTPEELEDERVAKALGFKNEKASNEFKAQRRELRDLRPMVEPAQKWTQMETYLRDNEIAPADFGAAMNVLAAFKSPNLQHKEIAFDILQENLKILGAQLGREAGGFDPLTLPQNKDLADRVATEELDRNTALEVAKGRSVQAHTAAVTQRQGEQQQTQQQMTEARNSAVESLNALGVTLKSVDPLFEQKSAQLVPVMKPIFARLHPSQWEAAYKEAYAGLQVAPVAAAPAGKPAPLRNQPLRPTGTKGGILSPEIKTDMDAVEAAIKAANELNGVAYAG